MDGNRALRHLKGLNMLSITDKSFRYTNSFNTDLRKKFRQLAQEKRAAAAGAKAAEAAMAGSVVPLVARRSGPKGSA
jgi:hypothetical protein